MTLVADAPPRPAWSLFGARVTRATELTPHLVRLTLGPDPDAAECAAFQHFANPGFDRRIKILLPAARGGEIPMVDGPNWHGRLRALPEAIRPTSRTYTIRAMRQVGTPQAEIDVDMVVHDCAGPASRWALIALADPAGADRVGLIGPDARCDTDPGGRAFTDSAETDLLIAGDESALPAITAIAERLSPAATGRILLEVPTRYDVIPLAAPAGVNVTFLPRDGADYGAKLTAAALAWQPLTTPARSHASTRLHATDRADDKTWEELAWEVPEDSDGGIRAWIAGEAAAVRSIRRHLIDTCRLDRSEVAFMGYWRRGRAES